MQKTAIVLIPFLLLLALVTRSSAAAPSEPAEKTPALSLAGLFDDPVIARGKGVEIKRSQMEEAFTAYKARMAERNQPVPEAQRSFVEKQLLDGLIVTKILVLRAGPDDKIKAKERKDKIISEYITNSGSEEMLKRQLKLRGSTLERFNTDVLEQEIARVVMEREVKSKLSVSDAQVEDFYKNGVDAVVKIMQEELERLAKDAGTTPAQLAATKNRIDDLRKANLARLDLPERVRVSHILLVNRNRQSGEELSADQKKAKRQVAEKLLARARAGENFTNLVQQYSEDRNLKETHGEYVFARHEPFAQEFKAAAFSLTNNQISDIVTTVFGFHIIKQHERIPTQKVELAKVADEIRNALLDQEFERHMPEFFDKVKKEAGVEILDPKYRFTATTARELAKPGR